MGEGDVENVETLRTLQSIGLSEGKAKETIKNNAVTQNLLLAIAEAQKCGPINPQIGVLLYHLATKIKSQIIEKMPFLVSYISSQKIDTTQRLDAALSFLLANINTDLDREAFEKACGIGIVITPEQVEECVEKYIKKYKEELVKMRYHFNVGILMQEVRQELQWADGKAIKNEVDMQILDLLGPKTEEDKKPLPKQVKSTAEKPKATKEAVESKKTQDDHGDCKTISELMKTKVHFHKVGENYKTDGYVITPKTMELLSQHLKITGGKVRTRFPPEPNGILHIGHAKAININFGYAAAHDGICFLRYDDTNPEKEEEQFFVGIKDMVEWLGYKPYKITHSSDYFDQLYEWAIVLIKKGLAYVCHQKPEDIKGFNPPPSPWRNRTVEENLKLFQDMKNGKFDEGEATLRMKITLAEGKEDPVAYRIKYASHCRTGDKWCIYPTYDYTHCLCDSIENITHSLCTKEFQSRRASYYWLCNALDVYCPVQWEYGRLSIKYTVTSKRKIAKLISENIVKDWDDPRLFTLSALRRRGFPPEAVNSFCARMGVTGALTAVDPQALEACVRDVLNVTAPRRMVVLEPLKVVILNFPESKAVPVEVPNFPGDPSKGSHTVQFDKVIYIEKNDFREADEPGYRRLTKTQSVGLRHAGFVISVKEVIKDSDNQIVELRVNCEPAANVSTKPKSFIHWVSNPIKICVRLFDPLFRHENPDDSTEVPGGFLSDCNTDSLHELESLADVSMNGSKVLENFQFERIGFFTVDRDSTRSKTCLSHIYNRQKCRFGKWIHLLRDIHVVFPEMDYNHFITEIYFSFFNEVLALIAAGYATELLPERYLKPQTFNHHPFTDVGVPASLKKASKIISPYAILSKKRPREGREFPPQNIIYYPTPHPSTVSRKQIDTNEIDHYEDPYVNIPKNYAFSYIVKDQHSGDDFSHSQAHNGKATRGQYRVKLPDGRTQIVSYTADHKGYRADVQYEEDVISKPFNKPLFKPFQTIPQTPAKLPEILPQSYQNYDTVYAIKHIPVVTSKIPAETAYTAARSYKSDSSNYIPNQSTPVTYVAENVPIKFYASAQPKPTVAPHYPPEYSQKFVSTTPTPYLRQEYVSSTVSQSYVPQHFIASTPLYPIQQVATTTATPTYDQGQYVNYHQISSTTSPQQAVIVTPKPIYNSAVEYRHL